MHVQRVGGSRDLRLWREEEEGEERHGTRAREAGLSIRLIPVNNERRLG